MVIYEGPRHIQKPGYRYPLCRICGEVWNTDKYMHTPVNGYICPDCERKIRRRK